MKLLNFLSNLIESVGKARAAAALSRLGRYEEARKLMTEN